MLKKLTSEQKRKIRELKKWFDEQLSFLRERKIQVKKNYIEKKTLIKKKELYKKIDEI
jgi:hypothetical protein